MQVLVIIGHVPTRAVDCLHTVAHANVVSLTRPMLFKFTVYRESPSAELVFSKFLIFL